MFNRCGVLSTTLLSLIRSKDLPVAQVPVAQVPVALRGPKGVRHNSEDWDGACARHNRRGREAWLLHYCAYAICP